MAPMQGLAGCSAKLGNETRDTFQHNKKSCYSHLDESGEPRGATRDPRGRSWRPPDGPDVGAVAAPKELEQVGVKVATKSFTF